MVNYAFPHILGSPSSYLTFQLIPSEFPYIWGNFRLHLKRHGNEADFLGVLQKLVPCRSLTIPFEPFRFWLKIRGDIHNRKTTPWLSESESRRLPDSLSRRVGDSPTRRVGESLWWVRGAIRIFKIYHHFKRLNQPFKRSIWQKRSQRCNALSPLTYLKVEKNCIYRQSGRLPDTASRGVVFRLRISPKLRS